MHKTWAIFVLSINPLNKARKTAVVVFHSTSAPANEFLNVALKGGSVARCEHIRAIDQPSPRSRQILQPHQPSPGVHPIILHRPAHFKRSLQLPTHSRTFGLPKNLATQLLVKLNARHPRRLALWHAGDG
jgi:hypothetical protein